MLTGVLLGSLLLLLWFIYPRKPEGLPPGRWGWPIIGALPTPGISFVEEVKQLRTKYGSDVISWRIGRRINIILFDYKTIKSVLSRPETADRPDLFTFQSGSFFSPNGVFASSGVLWNNNRRFVLRHLKDLGMGKSYLGDAIREEAAALVESFEKCSQDQPQELPMSINVAVVNVIWRMVADERYELDNEEIIGFIKMVHSMLLALDGPAKWLDLFDWAVPLIPNIAKRKLGLMVISDMTKNLTDYFMKFIEDHQKNLNPGNPKDIIDAYLLEMADPKSDLIEADSIDNLKITILNLFIAGSDTGASTIRWALLYMAKYPELQAKVQREIDSVVPRDTLPSLEHKDQLPYLDAMTNEVHRLVSLTPLSIPHSTSREMEIDGYTIPKGCVLLPHILYCHTDPQFWEKPTEFYPEHFLDEEGKALSKKEGFLPFSLGRRPCVGEALARMELFLFLGAILQNFTFTADETEDLSVERKVDERLSNLPHDFKLIITKRK